MIEEKFKFPDHEKWFETLQDAPNSSWIKDRSLGTKKSRYVPLFIQQALADLMFKEFDIVEENYLVVQNEILCTVKIRFLANYPDSDYRFMTGTGAKPIQQSSGSMASRFPDGKIINALEYNAPASRAAAISNALTTFANLFGRNLGRTASDNFSYSRADQKPKNQTNDK